MTHQLATKTNTIDKYLLDELTTKERSEFEEHLFDCAECTAQLKQDLANIETLKQVLKETPARQPAAESFWRKWLGQPFLWAPSAAAAGMALILGYQNLVSIPALLAPRVLDASPIPAATRGTDTHTLTVSKKSAQFAVSFDVASTQTAARYICQFSGPRSLTVDCGQHPTGEFVLNLLLPSSRFPVGEYTMVLRPAAEPSAELGRYSFVIRTED